MVGTGVLNIAIHVLGSTCTSGGYFRSKKSFLSKIATFGCFGGKMMHDFPYKMQTRLVHKSIPIGLLGCIRLTEED